ncbi:hypothetical protein [Alistipes shahii]|uniref:hypothetical protein n=1 Tax=Alistipes shahii TaxID=328814 RepID=UPI00307C18E5
MPLPILGLLKGIGSAIGSGAIDLGFNQLGKSISAAREQRYNERNMALQHEYQKKMVDYINDYNLPTKSVSRWKAAGIAPQAVFGNSPGGAGVASDASAPSSNNPGTDSNFSRFSQTLAEQRQMENDKKITDATVDKLKAEADKLRGDTKDQNETKRGQKLYNDGLDLTNKLTASKVINQGTQNELDALDLRMKNELFDTTVKIEEQKAENLAKQYEQMNQQIAESAARENLTNAQVQEVAGRIALNAAYAYLANTQAQWHGKVSQAQINEFVAKVTNLKELAEVAKSNKALTDVEKSLKALEYGDRSSVTSFNRTVGTALKYLSPLVLKM